MGTKLSGPRVSDNVIRVAWAAHRGAGENAGDEAEEFMLRLLPKEAFEMTDDGSGSDPFHERRLREESY